MADVHSIVVSPTNTSIDSSSGVSSPPSRHTGVAARCVFNHPEFPWRALPRSATVLCCPGPVRQENDGTVASTGGFVALGSALVPEVCENAPGTWLIGWLHDATKPASSMSALPRRRDDRAAAGPGCFLRLKQSKLQHVETHTTSDDDGGGDDDEDGDDEVAVRDDGPGSVETEEENEADLPGGSIEASPLVGEEDENDNKEENEDENEDEDADEDEDEDVPTWGIGGTTAAENLVIDGSGDATQARAKQAWLFLPAAHSFRESFKDGGRCRCRRSDRVTMTHGVPITSSVLAGYDYTNLVRLRPTPLNVHDATDDNDARSASMALWPWEVAVCLHRRCNDASFRVVALTVFAHVGGVEHALRVYGTLPGLPVIAKIVKDMHAAPFVWLPGDGTLRTRFLPTVPGEDMHSKVAAWVAARKEPVHGKRFSGHGHAHAHAAREADEDSSPCHVFTASSPTALVIPGTRIVLDWGNSSVSAAASTPDTDTGHRTGCSTGGLIVGPPGVGKFTGVVRGLIAERQRRQGVPQRLLCVVPHAYVPLRVRQLTAMFPECSLHVIVAMEDLTTLSWADLIAPSDSGSTITVVTRELLLSAAYRAHAGAAISSLANATPSPGAHIHAPARQLAGIVSAFRATELQTSYRARQRSRHNLGSGTAGAGSGVSVGAKAAAPAGAGAPASAFLQQARPSLLVTRKRNFATVLNGEEMVTAARAAFAAQLAVPALPPHHWTRHKKTPVFELATFDAVVYADMHAWSELLNARMTWGSYGRINEQADGRNPGRVPSFRRARTVYLYGNSVWATHATAPTQMHAPVPSSVSFAWTGLLSGASVSTPTTTATTTADAHGGVRRRVRRRSHVSGQEQRLEDSSSRRLPDIGRPPTLALEHLLQTSVLCVGECGYRSNCCVHEPVFKDVTPVKKVTLDSASALQEGNQWWDTVRMREQAGVLPPRMAGNGHNPYLCTCLYTVLPYTEPETVAVDPEPPSPSTTGGVRVWEQLTVPGPQHCAILPVHVDAVVPAIQDHSTIRRQILQHKLDTAQTRLDKRRSARRRETSAFLNAVEDTLRTWLQNGSESDTSDSDTSNSDTSNSDTSNSDDGTDDSSTDDSSDSSTDSSTASSTVGSSINGDNSDNNVSVAHMAPLGHDVSLQSGVWGDVQTWMRHYMPQCIDAADGAPTSVFDLLLFPDVQVDAQTAPLALAPAAPGPVELTTVSGLSREQGLARKIKRLQRQLEKVNQSSRNMSDRLHVLQKEGLCGNHTCNVCCVAPCNVVFRNCGHGGMCVSCAQTWLRRKASCPVCRAPCRAGTGDVILVIGQGKEECGQTAASAARELIACTTQRCATFPGMNEHAVDAGFFLDAFVHTPALWLSCVRDNACSSHAFWWRARLLALQRQGRVAVLLPCTRDLGRALLAELRAAQPSASENTSQTMLFPIVTWADVAVAATAAAAAASATSPETPRKPATPAQMLLQARDDVTKQHAALRNAHLMVFPDEVLVGGIPPAFTDVLLGRVHKSSTIHAANDGWTPALLASFAGRLCMPQYRIWAFTRCQQLAFSLS